MSEELGPYPQVNRAEEIARAAVVATAGMVPGVGAGVEFLDRVCVPAWVMRRDRWLAKLGELVDTLTVRLDGFDSTSLSTNELFISAVTKASIIAYGQHLDEKLDMLKHGLLHVALGEEVRDLLAMTFLRYVDQFELHHFLILRYGLNVEGWYADKQIQQRPSGTMTSPRNVAHEADLGLPAVELDVALYELAGARLVKPAVDEATGYGQAYDKLTTELGEQLLRFVCDIEPPAVAPEVE